MAAVALPWNAALGGVTSQVTDQVGAVVPGLLASAVLLGLFGLGFGTLVKNQVAAILLTIGGTLILEGILVALARAIFHYDLNWLPNAAGAALAGDIARGFGGGGGGGGGAGDLRLLTWWQGGLVMLAWGLGAADHRLLHDVPPRRHLSSAVIGRGSPGGGSAAQHDSGAGRQALFGRRTVDPDGHAVHQRVGHAHRRVRGQALTVGGEVAQAAQRARGHRLGVEDAQVGRLAHLDRAPVGQAVDARPARRSACGWPAPAA